MSKSNRVRLRDARNIYLLVGSCCEVGGDPDAWRRRMSEGLSELLSSRIIICGMLPINNSNPWSFVSPDAPGVFDWGWRDSGERATFVEYWDEQMVLSDPTFRAMQTLPQSLTVRRRCELVPDTVWRRSLHYNDFVRRWGIDDCMFTQVTPNPKSGVARLFLTAGRDIGLRRFSLRERRILLLFCMEIRERLGEALASPCATETEPLSPRMREVLVMLLAGDNEKQAARKLGISPHTVHSHVKRLHRHFNVSSRGELLAACHNWPHPTT